MNFLKTIYININKFIYFHLENLVNVILIFKIKFYEIINTYFKQNNNDYILDEVFLYTDLKNLYRVTNYFKNKDIKIINNDTIENIFKDYNLINDILILNNNSNIRLKIFFTYKDVKYIMYFKYDVLNNYYIPYPPYSEQILDNYRNNIIEPLYFKINNKNSFYMLFNIESKNILDIKINDEIIYDKNIIEYFNMIKTPFNDFGILYKCPIKLLWILSENNIEIENFSNFYLKFLNVYLDEINMELKEHFIDYSKNDIEKILISKRMEEILNIN